MLPALVLLASMIGFGSLARESGIGLLVALVSTVGVWGLPGQIAFVELYAIGASALVVIVAVSVANARFLPMTLSMLPIIRRGPGIRPWHFIAAQMISINIWTWNMRRCPELPHEQRVPFYFGFAIACMTSALIGTVAGFVLAGALPRVLTVGLVFLNPIYFALVFADVRTRAGIVALFLGAGLGPIVHLFSPDWGLLITGVIAGTAAFFYDRFWQRRHG